MDRDIDIIQETLGSEMEVCERISHGLMSRCFRVRQCGETFHVKVFVSRIGRRCTFDEGEAQQAAYERCRAGARVIHNRNFSGTKIIISEWLQGEMLVNDGYGEPRPFTQLGECLAAVHEMPLLNLDESKASMTNDAYPASPGDKAVNAPIVEQFEQRKDQIDRFLYLVDAVRANRIIGDPEEKRVFIHGDINPRNVLVSRSRDMVKLVDWGEAGVGRAAEDLARALVRLFDFPCNPARKEASHAFTTAYFAKANICIDAFIEAIGLSIARDIVGCGHWLRDDINNNDPRRLQFLQGDIDRLENLIRAGSGRSGRELLDSYIPVDRFPRHNARIGPGRKTAAGG